MTRFLLLFRPGSARSHQGRPWWQRAWPAPFVVQSKFELGKIRLLFYGVYRTFQFTYIYPVLKIILRHLTYLHVVRMKMVFKLYPAVKYNEVLEVVNARQLKVTFTGL